MTRSGCAEPEVGVRLDDVEILAKNSDLGTPQHMLGPVVVDLFLGVIVIDDAAVAWIGKGRAVDRAAGLDIESGCGLGHRRILAVVALVNNLDRLAGGLLIVRG